MYVNAALTSHFGLFRPAPTPTWNLVALNGSLCLPRPSCGCLPLGELSGAEQVSWMVGLLHPIHLIAYRFQGQGGSGAYPSWHWADKESTPINIHFHIHGQFKVTKIHVLHVFGLRGGQNTQREPTQTRWEHASSTISPRSGYEPWIFVLSVSSGWPRVRREWGTCRIKQVLWAIVMIKTIIYTALTWLSLKYSNSSILVILAWFHWIL